MLDLQVDNKNIYIHFTMNEWIGVDVTNALT